MLVKEAKLQSLTSIATILTIVAVTYYSLGAYKYFLEIRDKRNGEQ